MAPRVYISNIREFILVHAHTYMEREADLETQRRTYAVIYDIDVLRSSFLCICFAACVVVVGRFFLRYFSKMCRGETVSL